MAKTTYITRRTTLKALPFSSLAIAGSGASTAAQTTDQALLELGARFETAFAAEEVLRLASRETDDDDAFEVWEAASARTREIVDQIEHMPATSLGGLRIKARCLLWCSGDGTVTVCRGATADDRFARQIITSLLNA